MAKFSCDVDDRVWVGESKNNQLSTLTRRYLNTKPVYYPRRHGYQLCSGC